MASDTESARINRSAEPRPTELDASEWSRVLELRRMIERCNCATELLHDELAFAHSELAKILSEYERGLALLEAASLLPRTQTQWTGNCAALKHLREALLVDLTNLEAMTCPDCFEGKISCAKCGGDGREARVLGTRSCFLILFWASPTGHDVPAEIELPHTRLRLLVVDLRGAPSGKSSDSFRLTIADATRAASG